MNCSFEPDLSLDIWTESLLNSLAGRRHPLSASIELTERCNMACIHCYINQPPSDSAIQKKELSTAQWLEIIDQMADVGCLFLLISGGEPLLRKDFKDIFIHTRQRGMIVSLFSNGTMITPEIADFLAEYDLHSLEISVYGATAETYEKVTGLKGSFERCLRGIELALDRGIKTSLKTVLINQNFHELQALKDLAEHYDVNYRYDGLLWPRLDGEKDVISFCQIPQEDLLRLDFDDTERYDGWVEVKKQFEGQLLRSKQVISCGAAYRSFHIDAYGNLGACMMLRNPTFNLLDMKFSNAWEGLDIIRHKKRSQHIECEVCDINALCLQCPGWSMRCFEDYETPVPFICELGKKRSEQLNAIVI